MGFRICTVAARCDADDLAQAMGLVARGGAADQPDGDWWAARLTESGWTLLWAEDERFGHMAEARIAALSCRADVVVCEINETVMYSSATLWRDGAVLWRVGHRGDGEDVHDLTVTGAPPDGLAAIRARQVARQQAGDGQVDYIFDIPVELAASLTGFRHDLYLPDEATDGFLLLEPEVPAAPPRKGLLARLLGR